MCTFSSTGLYVGKVLLAKQSRASSLSHRPFRAALLFTDPYRNLAAAVRLVSCDCRSACWMVPSHFFPGLPALQFRPTCCLSLSCCMCGRYRNGLWLPALLGTVLPSWCRWSVTLRAGSQAGEMLLLALPYCKYSSSDTESLGRGSSESFCFLLPLTMA